MSYRHLKFNLSLIPMFMSTFLEAFHVGFFYGLYFFVSRFILTCSYSEPECYFLPLLYIFLYIYISYWIFSGSLKWCYLTELCHIALLRETKVLVVVNVYMFLKTDCHRCICVKSGLS